MMKIELVSQFLAFCLQQIIHIGESHAELADNCDQLDFWNLTVKDM